MSKSAAKYDIVPATEAHAVELAPAMRKEDADEIWASSRRRPLDALLYSLEVSRDTTQAGLADGRCVCLWGVAPASLLTDVGRPWLLASKEFERHASRFLRRNREYINEIRRQYPVLENWVDHRNVKSIRWLRWLGFDILPAEPIGPDAVPFHRFVMVSSCARQQ